MNAYAEPRRGRCASCEGHLSADYLYRMDETYCCIGCAGGGPCVCLYEQDVASDGVDGLGLPFAMGSGDPVPSGEPSDSRMPEVAAAHRA